jgi:hypothetical protein
MRIAVKRQLDQRATFYSPFDIQRLTVGSFSGILMFMKSKNPLPELEILGWKGVDLARRIHVTEETVSRWRTGKRKPPTLLAAYLKLCVWIHEKGYRVP